VKKKKAAVGYHRLQLSRKIRDSCDLGWRRSSAASQIGCSPPNDLNALVDRGLGMHVRILGSAAGGGFPQWNCGCPNCHAVREGTFAGKPRTQAQVAVSADRDSWFLLGASPDLRAQIDGCTDLHPRSVRDSPVAGLVLASADLDHVLGLLLLREIQPLSVYGTASVLNILRQDNSMFGVLNRVPRQVVWNSLASRQPVRLRLNSGEDAGISCEAVSLAGQYPVYAQASAELPREEAVSGLILTFDSGRSLAYFPNASHIDLDTMERLRSVDLLLFDGTFWSNEELAPLEAGMQTSIQMGHMPVCGEDGSLQRLRDLSPARKLYIHINNTNPMLNEAGPEFGEIRKAGWELAEDGWQLQL
jgi:pyrroloquinoline quinone biosynthesis protein B